MDTISRIIMTACICGTGISICQMISPDERFSKQINFILSLVFLTGILTPFKSFFDKVSETDISYSSVGYEFSADGKEMYEKYLKKTVENNIEKSFCAVLDKNNVEYEKVSVSIDISENYCISINKAEIISSEFEKASEIIKSETGGDFEIWDMNVYE